MIITIPLQNVAFLNKRENEMRSAIFAAVCHYYHYYSEKTALAKITFLVLNKNCDIYCVISNGKSISQYDLISLAF